MWLCNILKSKELNRCVWRVWCVEWKLPGWIWGFYILRNRTSTN
jgi:hypothetical protein